LIGRSAATLGDMSYQTLTNEGNVFSLFGTTLAGNQDYGVRLAKATLTSGQVLTLNTAPITVIAAPGAGKMITILEVSTKLTFGTAAYAANTQLSLKYVGAAYNACTDASTLVSGASRTLRWDQVVSTVASATNTQVVENAAVQITVNTGNPTTGDSSLSYYIYYVITTL
jgi:flagella basal body P-ring formation protein FlgA